MYTINTTARYIRMGKPYTSLQVYTERSRQLVCLERYGFHLKTGFRESRKFTIPHRFRTSHGKFIGQVFRNFKVNFWLIKILPFDQILCISISDFLALRKSMNPANTKDTSVKNACHVLKRCQLTMQMTVKMNKLVDKFLLESYRLWSGFVKSL